MEKKKAPLGAFSFATMVGRVGFEPTMRFPWWIMSPLPATNTASGPTQDKHYTRSNTHSGQNYVHCFGASLCSGKFAESSTTEKHFPLLNTP